jgi:hypothetical protein
MKTHGRPALVGLDALVGRWSAALPVPFFFPIFYFDLFIIIIFFRFFLRLRNAQLSSSIGAILRDLHTKVRP